ncbi:MAG: helix-turn-helix transcriptional regulator [Slackia sp.]|nr:helix-turn-helix transcriptional regulator [Slackia sp.]
MTAFDEYTASLGTRIRTLRKRAGLSLRTFGMMIGVHHNQILLIEQGKSNPSLQTLLRIADGLDIALPDLLPDRCTQQDEASYWFSKSDGRTSADEQGDGGASNR